MEICHANLFGYLTQTPFTYRFNMLNKQEKTPSNGWIATPSGELEPFEFQPLSAT